SSSFFSGRYLEYKALLGTTNTSVTPTLSDVTICYDNTCSGLTNGTACSDGNACTSSDTCQAGVCVGGPPPAADGDLHGSAACGGDDCNDTDAQVWSAPVDVTSLAVTGASPTDLSWDSQATLVGPETAYDVVSGSLPGGPSFDFGSSSCVQPGGGAGYS